MARPTTRSSRITGCSSIAWSIRIRAAICRRTTPSAAAGAISAARSTPTCNRIWVTWASTCSAATWPKAFACAIPEKKDPRRGTVGGKRALAGLARIWGSALEVVGDAKADVARRAPELHAFVVHVRRGGAAIPRIGGRGHRFVEHVVDHHVEAKLLVGPQRTIFGRQAQHVLPGLASGIARPRRLATTVVIVAAVTDGVALACAVVAQAG